MIHVLHTDSFVSYYPKYQINNMKAKLSENSLFGDSDRGEMGGGDATARPPPTKDRNISSQMVSGGQSSLFFFLHPP